MRYALAGRNPRPCSAHETSDSLHFDDVDDRGHHAECHGDSRAGDSLCHVDPIAAAPRRRHRRGNITGGGPSFGHRVAGDACGRLDLRAKTGTARGRATWLRKITLPGNPAAVPT